MDRNPLSGKSYYRLKQTDFDENYSFSDVIAMDRNTKQAIKIQPNPVLSNSLNISNAEDGDLAIKIYSINGQLLRTVSFNVVKDENDLKIEVGTFNNGIYILESVQNGKREIQRFVINKY